jgi:hypothetical protein
VDPTESRAGHREFVNLLAKLEADVADRQATGSLDEALRRWRTRHEELRSFDKPDDLITFVRDVDQDRHESKDRVLAALCAEGARGDDDAALLLVWLMFPGLLLLRRRLAARDGLDGDDLDAELLVGIWESAARVLPTTRYVAKRLLDGARRRTLAAIRHEEDWIGRIERLQGDIGESTLVDDVGETLDVLSEAVAAGVISQVEVELFRASRVSIPELRSRLGISESAARSRRLRAKWRLFDWLATSTPMAPQFGRVDPPQGVHKDSPTPRATDGPQRRPL